jgi:hypothetical protein
MGYGRSVAALDERGFVLISAVIDRRYRSLAALSEDLELLCCFVKLVEFL